ncbi:hypothetical protein PENTCL1PPCAC_23168, partial [Pristionchus entomophagus]
ASSFLHYFGVRVDSMGYCRRFHWLMGVLDLPFTQNDINIGGDMVTSHSRGRIVRHELIHLVGGEDCHDYSENGDSGETA